MKNHHATIALAGSLVPLIGIMSCARGESRGGHPSPATYVAQGKTQESSVEKSSVEYTLVEGMQASGACPEPPEDTALLYQWGDLEEHLKDIEYGRKDDDLWSLPTESAMSIFATTLDLIFAGLYEQAAQEAQRIHFRLIKHTDPARGVFYILQDIPNVNGIAPGGTYVWNPASRYNVIIEVPHPHFDSNTDNEGIELFLSSESALLLLSGTHRRSDLVRSTCDGSSSNDYRRSDPAHAEEHFFHVAHMRADGELDRPLFIQLHGFGSSGYDKLKDQCDHDPRGRDRELLVNVSDTYRDRSDDGSGAPPEGSFARILTETIDANGRIKGCLYNEDTESYGGTLNVQGRYTNGSVDPCEEYARSNYNRFIHLEQSYNTRRYERPLMIALIKEALRVYFGF